MQFIFTIFIIEYRVYICYLIKYGITLIERLFNFDKIKRTPKNFLKFSFHTATNFDFLIETMGRVGPTSET